MAEHDLSTLRICRHCDAAKPLSEFPLQRGRYFFKCKACSYASAQRWAERNADRTANTKREYVERHPDRVLLAKRNYEEQHPDRVAVSKRQHYERNVELAKQRAAKFKQENRERVNARYREQYAASPEIWKERVKRYKERHPDRVKALLKASGSRRRRHIESSPTHYTGDDVLTLLERQASECAEPTCKRSLQSCYHVDHIMPLVLGGSNGPENIQLLCPSCNLKKNRKDPYEWARLHGRLF